MPLLRRVAAPERPETIEDAKAEAPLRERVAARVAVRFRCECASTTLRFRRLEGGAKQYVRQCDRCGKCGKPIGRHRLDARELALALPVNEERAAEWAQAREKFASEMARRLKADESRQFWARYEEYLKSPEWRRRREKVLARDRHQCQACLEREASQVHHLTYERVFHEPLFDLISICDECHWSLHETRGRGR